MSAVILIVIYVCLFTVAVVIFGSCAAAVMG